MTTQTEGHRHYPQLIPRKLLRSGQVHHPAVLDEARRRSDDFQLRLADRITTFAGSMNFVWIHAALFALWMIVFERSPWPTLTLVVSLEAIFLSTFVMIGQNRQSAFQQARADHDFETQELELKTNTELTRQIHALTQELHQRVFGPSAEKGDQ
jgi:uncharacterized membrane protein